MIALAFVIAAAGGSLIRWASLRWWACTWQALFAVNVAGSALLGSLVGREVSASTLTIVGVGFAGSTTTFSSFVLELRRSRPGFALAYAALTSVSCVGVASIGATW